ncbi:MAG TPA: helix-turn-helix domain-containing protein [Polyangiaceae bacterium]|nr:helix-turn-helix domain-containing protein [Polyangiaceae bacterium]
MAFASRPSPPAPSRPWSCASPCAGSTPRPFLGPRGIDPALLADDEARIRDLLGETQSDVAGRLLLDPTLSVAEIAALLGFSEVAAFHRSLKRWTGFTPKQYRVERRGAVPSGLASP